MTFGLVGSYVVAKTVLLNATALAVRQSLFQQHSITGMARQATAMRSLPVKYE